MPENTRRLEQGDMYLNESERFHPTTRLNAENTPIDFRSILERPEDQHIETYPRATRALFTRSYNNLMEVRNIGPLHNKHYNIDSTTSQNIVTALLNRKDDPWFDDSPFRGALEDYQKLTKRMLELCNEDNPGLIFRPKLRVKGSFRPFSENLYLYFETYTDLYDEAWDGKYRNSFRVDLKWELTDDGLAIITTSNGGYSMKKLKKEFELRDTFVTKRDNDFDPNSNLAQAALFENTSRYIADSIISSTDKPPQKFTWFWQKKDTIPELDYRVEGVKI